MPDPQTPATISDPPPPTAGRLPHGDLLSTLAGILLLVRRSLRQHAFSTAITVLSVALASGLVMAVFAIQRQSEAAFVGGPVGFDAVLGARGSQLQLVLNTVFHLETSPGNIPWSLYQELSRRPYVKLAIPYALGDNYRGFRIVGATPELFTHFEYQRGRRFTLAPGGRVFDPQRMEAVIGSVAASRTGLRLGSIFRPYHGLEYNPNAQHAEEYVVVAVLEPSNTPSDRVIWIPIEGVFRMSGHVLKGAGDLYVPNPADVIPDEHKEVSAVMLKFSSPEIGRRLQEEVNRQGTVATLAWPIGSVMADLFEKIGWVNRVFQLVALLVIVVSAGTILAGVYNTIRERRREFAILRALGARRRIVFVAIVMESAAIGFLGSLLGYVLYALILAGVAIIVRQQTGVVLNWAELHWILWATPLGMAAVGALAGVLPAVKAYATDVASNLAPAT